ncbi:hypothetical protein [Amycolatopsis minnesotensis]|uniref:SMI1/KNR4 family protein n=1 Tax=Amycolatopsis minnesotensis TaxID=337894 RepID=A0ABN2R2F0_9PSEU
MNLGEKAAQRLIRIGGARLEPGLTDAEFARVEDQFGFTFADDHRAFLATALPVDGGREDGWPDWRDGDPEDLRRRLDRPADGVLFDVEHNRTWMRFWGERPEDLAERLEKARAELASVPTMVPVFSHRYLPAGRGTSGHAVLSIHQTDIIFYGTDLADYVEREFGQGPRDYDTWNPEATVPFWSEFC